GAARTAGVHRTRQAIPGCLHRELQRTATGGMPERELVFEPGRCAAENRGLAKGLQRTAPAQLVGIRATVPLCKSSDGDAGMKKVSAVMSRARGPQTPAPLSCTPSPARLRAPGSKFYSGETLTAVGTYNGGRPTSTSEKQTTLL